MQGAKCAISKLIYGSSVSLCTDDNQSLKLVAYRLVHTDEPYINLHVLLQRHTNYIPDCRKLFGGLENLYFIFFNS